MSKVTCHMSISLDGFVAGPDQSIDNPLGVLGRELHHWHLRDDDEMDPVDIATEPAKKVQASWPSMR